MEADLNTLANRFGTDKGDGVGNAHHYTILYAFLLQAWRLQEFNILELGLERGNGDVMVYLDPDRPIQDVPSIRMWLEYFPKAKCYGFDNADFGGILLPRFTFIRGNLSSDADLARLTRTVPPLRLIVDDASHASFHQQVAFLSLFDRVEPNGFYIIEDLDYQPPYEAELPQCLKTRDVFEKFSTSAQLQLPATGERCAAIAAQIRNVFIHQNPPTGPLAGITSLVVVQKA